MLDGHKENVGVNINEVGKVNETRRPLRWQSAGREHAFAPTGSPDPRGGTAALRQHHGQLPHIAY